MTVLALLLGGGELLAGSPALCLTRIIGRAASHSQSGMSSGFPATDDPALNNLITHIARQVGETIRDQLKGECDISGAQVPSSADQPSCNLNYPNLTGTKLVLQSDVKEPPTFRGDGSDRNTVREWEELMEVNLWKCDLTEQYSEIMSKLAGKAKDIVRITLRSSPSLKHRENPKLIYDILRQHLRDVTSCMWLTSTTQFQLQKSPLLTTGFG